MRQVLRFLAVVATLVLTLSFVVGVIWSVFEGAKWMVPALAKLPDQVLVALITASGTVLTAVATVVYSQKRSKDREIAEAHRASKIEIYQRFMGMLFDVLNKTRKGGAAGEFGEDLVEQIMVLKKDLIVWGSPGIIRAWNSFEKQSETRSTKERILLMDDILRAIRKDLGGSNWPTQRGELVQLFITDDLRKLET